jgi:hypothetical protein
MYQGRRKEQVESSYKTIFLCVISVIVLLITTALLT